jgi:hypothetical protein
VSLPAAPVVAPAPAAVVVVVSTVAPAFPEVVVVPVAASV